MSKVLEEYCIKNKLSSTKGVQLCRLGTKLTVVIPALNEQNFIKSTIMSLNKVTDSIEIAVVDNGSTDKTKDVVRNLASQINHPLELLECQTKGPVFARKRGMDEILVQYLTHGQLSIPRYIALVDADTLVPPNWVEVICRTFKETNASAVGGRYYYPHELDLIIEKTLGIKKYFKTIPRLAYFLSMNGASEILTNGGNSAIDIVSYAIIGGSKQPQDENGDFVKGSDLRFGDALRKIGKKVAFLPVMTETSARREIYALSKDIAQHKISSMQGWVDCRENDIKFLENILCNLKSEDLLQHMEERKSRFILRNVILPILTGRLDTKGLTRILGSSSQIIRFIDRAIFDMKNKPIEEIRPFAGKFVVRYRNEFLKEIDYAMDSCFFQIDDIISHE
jgi:glycosyltransferase involved in cell wall biosynthesis